MKSLLIIFALIFLSGCGAVSSHSEYYVLVGTYTRKSSDGIYVYKFDADDGSLTFVSEASGVKNPSYLTVSPNQKRVYAVNELDGNETGNVSSFSFNKKTGKLTFLNKQSSKGTAPCYVSVDQTGKYAFAANYSSGSFSMFPIKSDGSLQPARTTVPEHGSSVNKDRQSSPHVHCTHLTPDNKFLIVDDLGTDQISQYAFDASTATLSTDPVYQYKADPGVGPRHITFTPNGKYAFLVTEMGGKVYGFQYKNDRLHHQQTISAIPENYKGRISGADIHVSPDGNFLYASLRQDLNDIVIFSINQQSGKLTLVGRQSTKGKEPRNFMIDPTGSYVLAANENSDNVVVFKRNKLTGKLKPTGNEINVSMPVCLKMIPVE